MRKGRRRWCVGVVFGCRVLCMFLSLRDFGSAAVAVIFGAGNKPALAPSAILRIEPFAWGVRLAVTKGLVITRVKD